MGLFRLTLTTILHRKVWFVWLLLGALLPFVLPYMAPWEQDMTLLQPARAQAAWVTLWVAALTWGLFQATGFGENLATRGLGEYFAAQRVSRGAQFWQIWLACFIVLVPLLVVAVGICLIGAMPADKEEATAWCVLLGQYACLFLMVYGSLLCLAVALGTRLGIAGGYLVVFGLALYGLYGVGYLDLFFVQVHHSPVLETLWTFSPHYHLADLTERLIFKSGNLPAASFLQVSAYFAGLFLLHSGIAYWGFRTSRS